MENYETILGYVSTVLILVLTTITYIIKFIEKQREIKKMNDSNLLELELERLMMEAETLFDDGETREKFVIDRLRAYSLDYKIISNFDQLQNKIAKVISLSKEINVNRKEKLND